MGEARPPAKAEKKPVFTAETIFTELLVLVIILYILNKIFTYFKGGGSGEVGGGFSWAGFLQHAGLLGVYNSLASTFVFFSAVLSMLFILGIAYTGIRLLNLEKMWHASLYPEEETEAVAKPKNDRWQRVVAHVSSDNASDWRLAILECDIILDELLDKLGYLGGTIGERLKNATTAEFRTLDNAWEAHKIRNAIAHEGQDFTLTQREARRIVGLYESVFREFDFI